MLDWTPPADFNSILTHCRFELRSRPKFQLAIFLLFCITDLPAAARDHSTEYLSSSLKRMRLVTKIDIEVHCVFRDWIFFIGEFLMFLLNRDSLQNNHDRCAGRSIEL